MYCGYIYVNLCFAQLWSALELTATGTGYELYASDVSFVLRYFFLLQTLCSISKLSAPHFINMAQSWRPVKTLQYFLYQTQFEKLQRKLQVYITGCCCAKDELHLIASCNIISLILQKKTFNGLLISLLYHFFWFDFFYSLQTNILYLLNPRYF